MVETNLQQRMWGPWGRLGAFGSASSIIHPFFLQAYLCKCTLGLYSITSKSTLSGILYPSK